MSFQIEMRVCGYTIYNVGGHRLTTNKDGLNDYEYTVYHTPVDSIGFPIEKIGYTVSEVSEGEIKHQYDDGLMVLCEKILHKVNKELEEQE